MSPKNWRPSSSLSVDLAEAENEQPSTERPTSTASTLKQSQADLKLKKSTSDLKASSSSTSMRLSQKLERSLKLDQISAEEKSSNKPTAVFKSPVTPAKKETQSFMIKIPKNAQTRAKTELNLKKEKESSVTTVQRNMGLALNKSVTFISSEKKGPDSFRPKSAMTIKLEGNSPINSQSTGYYSLKGPVLIYLFYLDCLISHLSRQ